ncbi:MAG: enoyl-CoA hydratase/isomerase family protein [Deltaproteobacteria bacterium]|nr:enoyl-CoA hydratase/isomerase family protein [Deltaproteobacteria bacterium]
MTYKNILVEKKEGVARITINRPPLNILDIDTLEEMSQALADLRTDDEVKVVAITGAGQKAFSAGVAVGDHLGGKLARMVEVFNRLFISLVEVDKPTIAIVNGVALGGGCEIVAGCDMAVASEEAKLGQPEIKLGVYPPPASVLFPRILGRRKAFELILSGDSIDAKEAERIGLINKAVPAGELEEAVDEFIRRFTANSGLALTQARQALYRNFDLEFRQAMDVTGVDATLVMAGENSVEGLTAFMEKRKPVWIR